MGFGCKQAMALTTLKPVHGGENECQLSRSELSICSRNSLLLAKLGGSDRIPAVTEEWSMLTTLPIGPFLEFKVMPTCRSKVFSTGLKWARATIGFPNLHQQ